MLRIPTISSSLHFSSQPLFRLSHKASTVELSLQNFTSVRKMAKKPVTPAAAPKPATQSAHTTVTTPTPVQSTPKPASTTTPALSNKASAQDVALHVWQKYLNDTPSRTLLLDVFMLFLVLVGAIQFLYCLLVGNYVRPMRSDKYTSH